MTAPKPISLAKRWAKADPAIELVEEGDPLVVAIAGVEIEVRTADEGLVAEHAIAVPAHTLEALGEDPDDREAALAGILGRIVVARGGLLDGEIADGALRLHHPLHADGSSHHTFALALGEVVKARRAFEADLAARAIEESLDVGELFRDAGRTARAEPVTEPARPAADGWRPTHVVPPAGMPAYAAADPGAPPTADLAGGVQLRVLREWGAWAEVVGENGWRGWVDGRSLVRVG